MPKASVPDIVGQRFERLVVARVERGQAPNGRNQWYAICHCDCGGTSRALVNNLRRSVTTSCGCIQRERSAAALSAMRRTHGEGRRRLYYVWYAMKARCLSPAAVGYQNYGARGIEVCDAWMDYLTFRVWAEASGYREGLTLERKDYNGNYEPANCTWVSKAAQARNTRRNRYVKAFGERKLVCQWIKDPRCVVDHGMLNYRLGAGWPPEEAITAPRYSRYQRRA